MTVEPSPTPLPVDNRKDLVLLLLAARGEEAEAEPVVGVTRLQKYLFLLQEEHRWDEKFGIAEPYRFEAYDYGPFDAQLYADLEMLENAGLIQSERFGPEPRAEDDESRRRDIDWATLDPEVVPSEEEDQVLKFFLTAKGQAFVQRYQLDSGDHDVLTNIKATWNRRPLHELLRWLYRTHPDWATNTRLEHLRS
jgi:hypothetical protein